MRIRDGIGDMHKFSFFHTTSFTDGEWNRIRQDAAKIVERCRVGKIGLREAHDIDGLPGINERCIRFTGVGESENSYDLFQLGRWASQDNKDWIECETSYKPYGIAVALLLLRVQEIAPAALELLFPGKWDDNEWSVIRQVYSQLFGQEPILRAVTWEHHDPSR